jgi:hypothetical protein
MICAWVVGRGFIRRIWQPGGRLLAGIVGIGEMLLRCGSLPSAGASFLGAGVSGAPAHLEDAERIASRTATPTPRARACARALEPLWLLSTGLPCTGSGSDLFRAGNRYADVRHRSRDKAQWILATPFATRLWGSAFTDRS